MDTLQAVAVILRAADIRLVSVVVTAREAQDTNKFQSVIKRARANTSMSSCYTKSKKSYYNKRIWEAVVDTEDMEDTQEVMESHQAMEHQLKAMASQATNQATLLESNSAMPFRDIKLLNT